MEHQTAFQNCSKCVRLLFRPQLGTVHRSTEALLESQDLYKKSIQQSGVRSWKLLPDHMAMLRPPRIITYCQDQ